MAREVVAVGGGVSAAAYRLARDGVGVTLVDAGHEGQATAAGAGTISHAALLGLPCTGRDCSGSRPRYYFTLVSRLAEDGEERLCHRRGDHRRSGRRRTARLAEIAARLSEENERWPEAPVGEIDILAAE